MCARVRALSPCAAADCVTHGSTFLCPNAPSPLLQPNDPLPFGFGLSHLRVPGLVDNSTFFNRAYQQDRYYALQRSVYSIHNANSNQMRCPEHMSRSNCSCPWSHCTRKIDTGVYICPSDACSPATEPLLRL